MFLQERGCQVTIATSAAVVGGGLFHSAADVPARKRFAKVGGVMLPHTLVEGWAGDHVTLRSTLTGEAEHRSFDWLVIAETPVANDTVSHDLRAVSIDHHTIGDAVAPRRAVFAIYEARALAQQL